MIRVNVSTNLEVLDVAFEEVMAVIEKNVEQVAQLVYNEAKITSAFRDKTGNLRRSISVKKSRYEDGSYIVQARGKNRSDGGYHAHLIEFGHGLIAWGNVPKKTKFVSARPFMRPAKEKGIAEAMRLFK